MPTAISAFTVAVNDAGSVMPSRLTVRNPVSVKVTVYWPGRRSVILNWPAASVTAVRDPSMRAGLAASTVTPGRTPPDESFTTPAMPLPICASAGTAHPSATTNAARTPAARFRPIVFSLRSISGVKYNNRWRL